MAQSLRYTVVTLPFIYLGFLVGSNMSSMKSRDPVVEKRLSGWKANSLSIVGQLTLINSVLESLPVNHLYMFPSPISLTNFFETLQK